MYIISQNHCRSYKIVTVLMLFAGENKSSWKLSVLSFPSFCLSLSLSPPPSRPPLSLSPCQFLFPLSTSYFLSLFICLYISLFLSSPFLSLSIILFLLTLSPLPLSHSLLFSIPFSMCVRFSLPSYLFLLYLSLSNYLSPSPPPSQSLPFFLSLWSVIDVWIHWWQFITLYYVLLYCRRRDVYCTVGGDVEGESRWRGGMVGGSQGREGGESYYTEISPRTGRRRLFTSLAPIS